MDCRQDVSVGLLHDILLERGDNVLKGRNNDVSLVCLHVVSNETPNDVSVVRHQDVSVVRIHDVLFLRLYDISCKSEMKETANHVAVVRLHQVSQLRCRDVLYIFELLCHELSLVGFHVSFRYQIKHQIFEYQQGGKRPE